MESKNLKELEKLVKFCRKNGVTSLKSGEIELEIAPFALFPKSDYKLKKDQGDGIIPVDNVSDEDLLFWSSAGIPEMPEINEGTN